MEPKKWYQSKTVIIACLQAAVGLLSGLVLLLQEGLTSSAIAALGIGLKGVLDLKLRFVTKEPIQ